MSTSLEAMGKVSTHYVMFLWHEQKNEMALKVFLGAQGVSADL